MVLNPTNPAGTRLLTNIITRDHGMGFANIAQDTVGRKTPAGTGYPHACLLPHDVVEAEVLEWCRSNLGASSSWSVRILARSDADPYDIGLSRYGRYLVTTTMEQHVLAMMRWGA